MKKSIIFIHLLLLLSYSTATYAATVIQKASVNVISGTYQGETGEAYIIYNDSTSKGVGEETIQGQEIIFKFLGKSLSGKPSIVLRDGKFKDVLWVASIQNQENETFNFGFNSGFNRNQFTRSSEAFIPAGASYFGYLFPDTYVDGAGIITYKELTAITPVEHGK